MAHSIVRFSKSRFYLATLTLLRSRPRVNALGHLIGAKQSRVLIRVISPPIEAVGGTSVGIPSEKGGACELAYDSTQYEPLASRWGKDYPGRLQKPLHKSCEMLNHSATAYQADHLVIINARLFQAKSLATSHRPILLAKRNVDWIQRRSSPIKRMIIFSPRSEDVFLRDAHAGVAPFLFLDTCRAQDVFLK